MSTPAAQVLEGAGPAGGASPAAAPAGAAPVVPGPGAPGAQPAGGSPGAANQPFFSSWDKPEQKDVREWVANKAYADPFVLAKSARELETTVSTLRAAANLKGYPADKVNADGTVVPADANARKAWNESMGVPATAAEYDIPMPEGNPYPEYKTFMAEEFHKLGVPAAMATAIARANEQAVARLETKLRETENTQSQAALLELEREWGANFKERTALAQRGKTWLAKEVGGLDDIQMRTLESTLGTAKFLSAMWKIGQANGESRFAGGAGKGVDFGNSAQSAQARLDQVTAERSAGKMSDAQHREFMKPGGEFESLQAQILAGMPGASP